MAEIVALRHLKGVPFLKQGIKNGRVPHNQYKTIAGGAGTFLQVDHSDLLATVKLDDGSMSDVSIYRSVLDATGRERLSAKLLATLHKKLPFVVHVSKSDNGLSIDEADVKGIVR